MDIFEVKNALEKICVLVDTREQDTMAKTLWLLENELKISDSLMKGKS